MRPIALIASIALWSHSSQNWAISSSFSAVKVAFSLAFARDKAGTEAGFATCQQHFPENFWNPAFQQHANTASAIGAVVVVAENPSDHHIFLSAFSGVRDLHATSSGVTAATPRGDIKMMDPSAFRGHFGTEPPDISRGARLAALQFRVRDRAALTAALGTGGIAFASHMERIVVRPEQAMGATIVFT